MVTSPRYRALTFCPWSALSDPDVRRYVQAVESADGASLELPVRKAIHEFITGCKADGIWPALKASCILAGARTLSGALVPLVGTAPTNFNFVSGDYNRKTGLAGNGATKYLNSNRANNADPQNSKHIAVMTAPGAPASVMMASRNGTSGVTTMDTLGVGFRLGINSTSANIQDAVSSPSGFMGGSRNSPDFISRRYNSSSALGDTTSVTPHSDSLLVFARRNVSTGLPESWSSARLTFYSIGESLNLTLLDARVSQLINTFAAVIP